MSVFSGGWCTVSRYVLWWSVVVRRTKAQDLNYVLSELLLWLDWADDDGMSATGCNAANIILLWIITCKRYDGQAIRITYNSPSWVVTICIEEQTHFEWILFLWILRQTFWFSTQFIISVCLFYIYTTSCLVKWPSSLPSTRPQHTAVTWIATKVSQLKILYHCPHILQSWQCTENIIKCNNSKC